MMMAWTQRMHGPAEKLSCRALTGKGWRIIEEMRRNVWHERRRRKCLWCRTIWAVDLFCRSDMALEEQKNGSVFHNQNGSF